jgi:hypothetical protein
MNEKSSWKSRLLSSSVPLEHAVARLLASRGFAVRAEYAYSRDNQGVPTDYSVDLLGTIRLPDVHASPAVTLRALIECKYRWPRNSKWLFLPDPNDTRLLPLEIGAVPIVVDEFSRFTVDPSPALRLYDQGTTTYKVTELHPNGSVDDREVKHGVEQLRYALPRLLRTSIEQSMTDPWESSTPFACVPILVTTADLLLAPDDFSPETVAASNELADLGPSVPWLFYRSGHGPDFERHCYDTFELFRSTRRMLPYKGRLDDLAAARGTASARSLLSHLSNGSPGAGFEEVIVCRFDALEPLLDVLCRTTAAIAETASEAST